MHVCPHFPEHHWHVYPKQVQLEVQAASAESQTTPSTTNSAQHPLRMRNRDPSCRKGVTLSIVLVDPLLLIGLHSFHMQLLGYTMLTYRYVRENCRDNEESRMDSDGGLSLLN